MQQGRGGGDGFFGSGDMFAGFGGFGRPRSLISSFFGGRDPFDDPFFTQPFGGMFGPSMLGPRMFGHNIFGAGGSPFGDPTHGGFLEQAPRTKSKGPIIKELSSDDEEEGQREDIGGTKQNPRKHSRSGKEPHVQDPEEEVEEKNSRRRKYRREFSGASTAQPQNHSFSFQSSTVTYGGTNGAYYTSSTTRRTGGGGVTVEESKEADTTTGKATHRVSRGLGAKGHSVTRKLNADRRVDTMQTLHNLNEDELAGFEEAWKGNARQHLPRWNQSLDMLDDGNRRGSIGAGRGGQTGQASRVWALPSTEQPQGPTRRMASHAATRTNNSSTGQ